MKLITNANIAGVPGCWLLADDEKNVIVATDCGNVPPEIAAKADSTVFANGAVLIPGLTDSHVHFREPGLTRKGSIATESLAARAGGITTVIDMPNTVPATTTAEALREKVALGRSKSAVHYHAFFGAVPGCMAEVVKFKPGEIPGVKVFLGASTGSMAAPDDKELLELMRWCVDNNLPMMVHAEDNDIIARNTAAAIERYGSAEAVPVSMHSEIRSEEACLKATAKAVEMAMRTGVRLHIAHVSTASEVREFLTAGPTAGKQITAETTPMYMDPVLADVANRTSLHKINPAIKTPADAEALRAAVISGAIDTIGTDHAPHLLGEKQGGALTAASGAPSIQFAVPIMMEYIPLKVIVERMTAGPYAIFGVGSRGVIAPGETADLALVAHTGPRIITKDSIISPCRWSPFEDRITYYSVTAV